VQRRTLKLESHTVRDTLDASTPELLVQFRVDTNVRSAHMFSCKLDHGLQGAVEYKGGIIRGREREQSIYTLTAHGARFLNDRPWTRLWRWMVYSRVTTSSRALRLPVCGLIVMILSARNDFYNEYTETDPFLSRFRRGLFVHKNKHLISLGSSI